MTANNQGDLGGRIVLANGPAMSAVLDSYSGLTWRGLVWRGRALMWNGKTLARAGAPAVDPSEES